MTKPRLVVIDDNEDLRDTLCHTLGVEGFDVSGFSEATEAIRRIESGLPADLILLDLMMPIMNGWEFCQYRATSAALRRVPVVIITARHGVAPPVGVSEVLLKPFDLDVLDAVIARALTTGGWDSKA